MFDIQSKYIKETYPDRYFNEISSLLSYSMLIELYHCANADALRCQYMILNKNIK